MASLDEFVEKVSDEAREREFSAEQDPMVRQQADIVENPQEVAIEPDSYSIYGSLRVRYRDTGGGAVWGDGGSRLGISGRAQFHPGYWLLGRAEAGFNVLDTADLIFDAGDRPPGSKIGDSVFLRLLYLGVETPDYQVTLGKNWSTFYRVSSFTDRFQGAGGSASGTYNAGTDGGFTGTGRADRALQVRFVLNDFDEDATLRPQTLNLQVQRGEPIPLIGDVNYRTTIGASTVMDTNFGFALGIAYNHAFIDDDDLPLLAPRGIDDDATALAVGLRWYREHWYLGIVASWLENHEATTQGNFFDGTGTEVYGQYRLYQRIWGVAGWNRLEPDASETQAGQFLIDYTMLGLRYSIREFSQMIFANVRLDSSKTYDGQEPGDVYTIGVRWDLP